MILFNKELVKKRFALHLKEYNELSVVQRDICKKLSERLFVFTSSHTLPQGNGYEIGAGTGFLTRHILDNYPNTKWYINDLVPEAESFIADVVAESRNKNVIYVWNDAEKLRLIGEVSLLVSSSAMQWFNSIETYLESIYPSIAKGGFVAFSIFGKRNFQQVRESSGGIGLDYPTLEEVEIWAEKCGFEVIESEDYTQTIYFETPSDVLSYIKQSGMNGNSSQKWTKSDYERFCEHYITHFAEDGKIPLTFNPLQLILRK